MGATQSSLFRNFDLGDYWIGKPLSSAKRGLAFHFPTRMIRTVSSSDMLQLGRDPPEPDDIIVIYDPRDKTAQQIVTGWEF